MKRRIVFLLLLTFTLLNQGFSTKVISASDDDWDNILSWNTMQVPVNPDTIIIRHYITFGHDFTLNAPTVLIIEEDGTLCGDYLMDVLCGARVLNYGRWYVNALKIRSSSNYNYNDFYFKTNWTLTGCGLSQTGGPASFYNVPPNGHINTWAPTLCKTSDTNWPKATTGIPGNGPREEFFLSISPNPLNSGYLGISANGDFDMRLYDTRGILLYKGSGTDKAYIDVHDYSNGFYFVALTYKNIQIIRKVLIAQ